jgi:hypothetical protein
MNLCQRFFSNEPFLLFKKEKLIICDKTRTRRTGNACESFKDYYYSGKINEIKNSIKIKLAYPGILQRYDSEYG